MGRKRERVAPLTRWQYFTKTLYSDAASRAEFEYDRVIYFKSEELQRIEAGNRRIHGLLLVILCLGLSRFPAGLPRPFSYHSQITYAVLTPENKFPGLGSFPFARRY